MDYTKEELQMALDNSLAMSDVIRYFNLPEGGGYRRKLKALIIQYELDSSHLNGSKAIIAKNTKWEKSIINCPICENEFETQVGHPREKKTCGYACSNTFFRSGPDNPNWKEDKYSNQYRRICFSYYEEKCTACDETIAVDVHHLDKNRDNNDISNLIPLCPTHHAYMHRGHEHLIQEHIDNFMLQLNH